MPKLQSISFINKYDVIKENLYIHNLTKSVYLNISEKNKYFYSLITTEF